ncbi:hypothetical protein MFIFM68171_02661 [Madurella fahalii]|uniref:DUF7580 domain-containing protein n=1 Tax=Madurella fahalii TaxID=1157608 RepID=A0ABQ0G3W0_9PEZI
MWAISTLETFLTRGSQQAGVRLTPKQRALLAADIASSILPFQRTHWLSSPWSSQTIRFAVPPANTGQSCGNRLTVGAFIEQNHDALKSTGPVPNLEPQAALLELSILLLEIWHQKSLKDWALEAKTEVNTPDSRRIAATGWLQATDKELPVNYLDAIEQCLAICSGKLRCEAWIG